MSSSFLKNSDFLSFFKVPEKKDLLKTVQQRRVSMEAGNPRCSVNRVREVTLSDSIHDVWMESFCSSPNKTEHSMEQPFKKRAMMNRKGKAFDDYEVSVVYYQCREMQIR